MTNIALFNVYGQKNIGDTAIQESALSFLNKILSKNSMISLLSVDSKFYKTNLLLRPKIVGFQLPYGHAIDSVKKPISSSRKLIRFTRLFTGSLYYSYLGLLNKKFIPREGTYAYIYALAEAETVVGMGGGYFTTRNKVGDYFGLLLTLLPIYIAKMYSKKIVFLPLTFGSFASRHHQKITHKILRGTTVFCRDKQSMEEIEKLNTRTNSVTTMYFPDLALYRPWSFSNMEEKYQSTYYVITAREWLQKDKQTNMEEELIHFIKSMWKKYKLQAIFISMAFNSIEDDDNRVGLRIQDKIKNKNIFHVARAYDPQEAQRILLDSRFAICTRMHSAILSMVTGTPFVSLAYSVKTNRFLQDFNLDKWNINIENVTAGKLKKKVTTLMKKHIYGRYIHTMKSHKKSLDEYKFQLSKQLTTYIYE